MAKLSRNAILKIHLADIEACAHAAKAQTDIQNIARKIENYAQTSEYKFNQTLPIIGMCVAGLAGLLSYWGQMNISDGQRMFLLIFAIITACICLAIMWFRFSRVKSVSALVYLKAVTIKASIMRDYSYNGKAYWNELKHSFSLFNCGNESQAITQRYLGETEQTPFTLFEFKYVDVSTHVSTDSKGRTTTRKQRSTRYKYGMLVQLSDFNYLSINTKRFTYTWDSASRRFNKLFKIRCSSEIAAAKFFDPKTVLRFVDSYHFVKSLDTTAQSLVCIELPKQVFPTHIKSPSLRDHDNFVRQINKPTSIPTLEKTKELVQLIRQQR